MPRPLIVVALALVALSACSSSDDSSSADNSGTGSAAATPTIGEAVSTDLAGTVVDTTDAVQRDVVTSEVATSVVVDTEAPTTAEADATTTASSDVETADTMMQVTDATMPDPALADAAPPDGSILMVKLPVGDDEAAQEFYGNVFGVTLAMEMGDRVRIVMFPGGGPGLVLIPEDPENERNGSFIVQVTNMESTLARAVANGATLEQTFEGEQGGGAQSTNILDPWGNQIEVLQLG